jgi:hypothetical protein
LPSRFTTVIEGDWLPYRVELDLAATPGDVTCLAVRLEAREDGDPVTARGVRDVPLGECIRLATASSRRVVREEDGQLVIELAGPLGEMEEFDLGSRPQRRVDKARLREAADIYVDAKENPTKAVRERHSQGPISYSTAARWVMEARRLGFLPPAKRGRASATKED